MKNKVNIVEKGKVLNEKIYEFINQNYLYIKTAKDIVNNIYIYENGDIPNEDHWEGVGITFNKTLLKDISFLNAILNITTNADEANLEVEDKCYLEWWVD